MKRYFSLLLAAILTLTLCSCNGNSAAQSTLPASETSQATGSAPGDSNAESAAKSTTDFPSKNVKIIVPFNPGGGVDVSCRMIADAAGKDHFNNHSLIVENMGGGGAVIGQTYVANADPDGYTILAYTSSVVTNPMFNETTYDYTDFQLIAMYCFDPELIVVPKDSPYNTLQELLDASKEKSVSLATPGHATSHHIAALNLANLTGAQFDYIHNDSGSEQINQIMGGHVDCAMIASGEGAPYIQDGSIKALGVMAETRLDSIPDVPIFAESGYDMVDGAFRGLAVPKDTPAEVVSVLEQEFAKVLNSEKFKNAMNEASIPWAYKNAADFTGYVEGVARTMEKLLPVLVEQ